MNKIDVPGNIFIPCPKKGFKLVSVKKNCSGCEFSQGLIVVNDGDVEFKDKFRVLCGKPISRRIEEIEL